MKINKTLIMKTMFQGDKHLGFDAIHFEARDASKPSEKKEKIPKKRGRKSNT